MQGDHRVAIRCEMRLLTVGPRWVVSIMCAADKRRDTRKRQRGTGRSRLHRVDSRRSVTLQICRRLNLLHRATLVHWDEACWLRNHLHRRPTYDEKVTYPNGLQHRMQGLLAMSSVVWHAFQIAGELATALECLQTAQNAHQHNLHDSNSPKPSTNACLISHARINIS